MGPKPPTSYYAVASLNRLGRRYVLIWLESQCDRAGYFICFSSRPPTEGLGRNDVIGRSQYGSEYANGPKDCPKGLVETPPDPFQPNTRASPKTGNILFVAKMFGFRVHADVRQRVPGKGTTSGDNCLAIAPTCRAQHRILFLSV